MIYARFNPIASIQPTHSHSISVQTKHQIKTLFEKRIKNDGSIDTQQRIKDPLKTDLSHLLSFSSDTMVVYPLFDPHPSKYGRLIMTSGTYGIPQMENLDPYCHLSSNADLFLGAKEQRKKVSKQSKEGKAPNKLFNWDIKGEGEENRTDQCSQISQEALPKIPKESQQRDMSCDLIFDQINALNSVPRWHEYSTVQEYETKEIPCKEPEDSFITQEVSRVKKTNERTFSVILIGDYNRSVFNYSLNISGKGHLSDDYSSLFQIQCHSKLKKYFQNSEIATHQKPKQILMKEMLEQLLSDETKGLFKKFDDQHGIWVPNLELLEQYLYEISFKENTQNKLKLRKLFDLYYICPLRQENESYSMEPFHQILQQQQSSHFYHDSMLIHSATLAQNLAAQS